MNQNLPNHNTQNQIIIDLSDFEDNELVVIDLRTFKAILDLSKITLNIFNQSDLLTIKVVLHQKVVNIIGMNNSNLKSKVTSNTNIIKYKATDEEGDNSFD